MTKVINDVFLGRLQFLHDHNKESIDMFIDHMEDLANETKRLQFETKGNKPLPALFRMAVQNVSNRIEYVPVDQRKRTMALQMMQ